MSSSGEKVETPEQRAKREKKEAKIKAALEASDRAAERDQKAKEAAISVMKKHDEKKGGGDAAANKEDGGGDPKPLDADKVTAAHLKLQANPAWKFLTEKLNEYLTGDNGSGDADATLAKKVELFLNPARSKQASDHDVYAFAQQMLNELAGNDFGTEELKTALASVPSVDKPADCDAQVQAINAQGDKIKAIDAEYRAGVLDNFLAECLRAANDGEGVSVVARKVFGVELGDGADAQCPLKMLAPSGYHGDPSVTVDDADYATYCLGLRKAIFENAIDVAD